MAMSLVGGLELCAGEVYDYRGVCQLRVRFNFFVDGLFPRRERLIWAVEDLLLLLISHGMKSR